MLGHLQAAFNYEPINMRCAVRGAAAWAAALPLPPPPLPASAPRKIGFCAVHVLSLLHVRYRTWAVDNFILPPLIECSTEMSVCDVPRSAAAVAGGDTTQATSSGLLLSTGAE